jgi:hypothetical protein
VSSPAKVLIAAGLVLVAAGLAVAFLPRVPFLGRLPGDFTIRRGNFTLYLPLATSVLLSLIVTVLLRLFTRP